MQIKTNSLAKPLFIGILFMVSGWIEVGHAFEPWEGEVSTNVNLRGSPGLDQ